MQDCASSNKWSICCRKQYGNPGGTDIIDYVQIASEGDAIDFGDLLGNRQRGPGWF